MNILVQGGRVVDPASGRDEAADIAEKTGYPVIVKADAGGGGTGSRPG